MATETLDLSAQRGLRWNGMGTNQEFTSGKIVAGYDYAESSAVLQFPMPSESAGHTINSVTLHLRGQSNAIDGQHQGLIAIVANDSNLASQNLNTAPQTATALKFHSQSYTSPGTSTLIPATVDDYTFDLTSQFATAISVGNLDTYFLVSIKKGTYQSQIGPQAGHFFDGLGDGTPPTIVIDYTTGGSGVDADLATTDGNDTLASAATTAVRASLIVVDGDDQLAASASPAVMAELQTSDADDTAGLSASVLVSGVVNTDDDDDVVAIVASNFNPSGTVDATDDNDTLIASSVTRVTASLSGAESDDTLSSTAANFNNAGNVASTESDDVLSSTASVLVTAIVDFTDDDDTASGSFTQSERRTGVFPRGVFLRSPSTANVFLGT
ncbi:MAG: hypothetical protein WBD31_13330 [Rubripirellula sp.]